MPEPAASPRFSLWRLWLPLLGALGIAALWVLLSLLLGRWSGAFALVAALDLIWMVRLARLPRGNARGLVAAAGTGLAIVLANWWLLAAHVGGLLGMLPWQGVPLMGADFAWTLARMMNTPMDLLSVLAALLLAGWKGR